MHYNSSPFDASFVANCEENMGRHPTRRIFMPAPGAANLFGIRFHLASFTTVNGNSVIAFEVSGFRFWIIVVTSHVCPHDGFPLPPRSTPT